MLKGRVHKFGDDINTDYIISGKYKFNTLNLNDLARHVMEDVDPEFYKKCKPGDFIVAGDNFGCGSSREQAPLAIKYAKVGAVIAKSFARIFFRNAINVGLPLFECDTGRIENGDKIEVDLKKGTIFTRTKNFTLQSHPLPEIMIKILNAGGLAKYFKKYGGF